MSTLASSREFWNSKAKANPYWYISSFGPYEGRDLKGFWQSGETIWKEIKSACGYAPRGDDVIVEIGCGVGRLTRAIAPEVGIVHSFDISEEMLRQAKMNVPANVDLHVAQGNSLRLISSSHADFTLAYCVFQHLPTISDLREYLAEIVRVAKRGGMIAFTMNERDWTWTLLPLLRLKAFAKSSLGLQPPDLYRREWLGIRPRVKQVLQLCSVRLEVKDIGGERVLFWGKV